MAIVAGWGWNDENGMCLVYHTQIKIPSLLYAPEKEIELTTEQTIYVCHNAGETMSPKLHRVQVPLMNRAECEKSFRTAGYAVEIDKTKVCAGWPEGGKDACQVAIHHFGLPNLMSLLTNDSSSTKIVDSMTQSRPCSHRILLLKQENLKIHFSKQEGKKQPVVLVDLCRC